MTIYIDRICIHSLRLPGSLQKFALSTGKIPRVSVSFG